jgi:hypothetical protein
MQNGVEIRRVAVLDSCSIKTALRFITKGSYLVLEVYDEAENRLFNLTQNELAELFSTQDVYAPISLALQKRDRKILSTA